MTCWNQVNKKKIQVKITQFKPPDGRQVDQYSWVSVELGPAYHAMRDSGCELHSEILSTEEVSVSISDGDHDLDIEVVANGPEVQQAICRLLTNRSWEIESGESDAKQIEPTAKLADGTTDS